MSTSQSALALPVELPSPVMFSKGMLIPIASKNSLIAGADSLALAVNINMSLSPAASFIFFINSNSGPFLPSTTLLKSVKSITQPASTNSFPFVANSSAVKTFLLPSLSANTLLLVLATVSSKSNTLAFLIVLLRSLANLNALSLLLSSFLISDLLKSLLAIEASLATSMFWFLSFW